MARGRSISITAVVMDGPITEARCLSWGSNNAVRVKEDKTSYSSGRGAKSLRCINIWIKSFICYVQTSRCNKEARGQLVSRMASRRKNASGCFYEYIWYMPFHKRVPNFLGDKSIKLNIHYSVSSKSQSFNSGQIRLNFYISFSLYWKPP